MKDEQCASCKFFKVYEHRENQGICRRRAPTTLIYADGYHFVQPEVCDEDWCGEYKEFEPNISKVFLREPEYSILKNQVAKVASQKGQEFNYSEGDGWFVYGAARVELELVE